MAANAKEPLIVLTDADDELPKDERCPRCRKGPEHRVKSSGFGAPHPVCSQCGYEWHDEEWRG